MSEEQVDRLACDLALLALAEWVAIENNKTRLQSEEYTEEAETLAGYLYVLGYRLTDGKGNILSAQPGVNDISGMKPTKE